MEKSGLFQIGDVANMFHISVGTLRHYETSGLLQPEYTDNKTGYRYYSTRQFECLNTIRYLRVLDMPLEQIADFINNRDVERMQIMLRQQKETVISKQKELEIIERKIENRLRQIEDALSSQLDTICIRQFESRRIAWIENTLSINSYLDLETSIRQLEQHQQNTVVFLGKVGVGIAREKLLNGEYNKYDKVFLLLDKEDAYSGPVEEIPEETCVTLRFCGGHKEAFVYYERLMDFITEQNFRISGFSKEITMIDYGITDDTKKFVTEIQIPIFHSEAQS